MESATIFVRVMKKLLHLVSIPQSLLKGHIQDSDVQSLDRKYVVQVLKLRSDFYRSEEVRELCRDVEANEVWCVCYLRVRIVNEGCFAVEMCYLGLEGVLLLERVFLLRDTI